MSLSFTPIAGGPNGGLVGLDPAVNGTANGVTFTQTASFVVSATPASYTRTLRAYRDQVSFFRSRTCSPQCAVDPVKTILENEAFDVLIVLDGTATGVTFTEEVTFIPGTAQVVVNGNASGVTFTQTASLISGTASGIRNPTVNGVTFTQTASLIDGTASGIRNPTVNGVTFTQSASLIAGSGQGDATASGTTFTQTASLIAGTASGIRNPTVTGATFTQTASIVSGAASGTISGNAAGATLAVTSSLVPGTASGAVSVTASGVTFTRNSSLVLDADPNFADVRLLLGFDTGADGSTSTSDESLAGNAITFRGNAQIDTAIKQFGNSALLLPNQRGTDTSSKITAPSGSNWAIGANQPFTFEVWAYRPASVSYWMDYVLFTNQEPFSGEGIFWSIEADRVYFIGVNSSTINVFGNLSETSITTGWHHFAVDRDSSNNIRLYYDGNMIAKVTNGAAIPDSGYMATIGGWGPDPNIYSLEGSIDEFRFTKGVARYGSDAGYSLQTARFPRSASPAFGESATVASGATLSTTASLIAGNATGQRNPTQAGETLSVTSSLISGNATGQRNPTASGQTFTQNATLTAGAAQVSDTGDGVTFTQNATFVAGAPQVTDTADGVTFTQTASLISGAPQVSDTGDGVTFTQTSSLIAGTASGIRNPTASGQTFTQNATLSAGAGSGTANVNGVTFAN